MGYSDNDAMVRVDFFKPSGKWYCTEAVLWVGDYNGNDIFKEFVFSLLNHFKDNPTRLCEMDAVCLKPYHKYAHPIQIKAGGWRD